MGMDDSPQLEDLLKEYTALANERKKQQIEKKQAAAETANQEKTEKMCAYEASKGELASVLHETTDGDYAPTLIRILKDQPTSALHLGTFTRVQHGATTQQYTYTYGIGTNEGAVAFYVDDGHNKTYPHELEEMLSLVTVRGIDNLPKLVLTAKQYKEDLTGAVNVALTKLRVSMIQEKPQV